MSNSNNNQLNIPQAREAMDRFKMLICSGGWRQPDYCYNGHLTSREAGNLGGQMVKKMYPYEVQNMNGPAVLHRAMCKLCST